MLILDMNRVIINLIHQAKISLTNVCIKQQRAIQTSINRLQSVEEVNFV
jgi:hypothetical protein